MTESLGELFARVAGAGGMTPKTLAPICGVRYEVILRAFKDSVEPEEKTAAKIGDALGIEEVEWKPARLETIRRRRTPPTALSLFVKRVMEQWEFIVPSGISHIKGVRVPLTQIYVSLQAEADSARIDREIEALRERARAARAGDGVGAEDGSGSGAGSADGAGHEDGTVYGGAFRGAAPILDLQQVVAANPILVIVGPPGCGKSTLLRFIAVRMAQLVESDERQPLAVYCRVSEYAESLAAGSRETLREFVAGRVLPGKTMESDGRKLFDEMFAKKRCMVLLDGLDEVTSDRNREAVNAAILALAEECRKAGNRLIVTSRIRGYHESPLVQVPVFAVRPMSDSQVEQFLERWLIAMERAGGASRPEAAGKREAAKLVAAIRRNPGVRSLAVNPLLCTLIALIHRNRFQLPERRVVLLRDAVETLLHYWRAAQVGADPEELSRFEISADEESNLLRPLAFRLHAERDSGMVDEATLISWLSEFLSEWRGREAPTPADTTDVVRFLDRVKLHCGILVESADRHYSFMHLLFEEYLAGLHLVNRRRREAVTLVRRLRHDPRWEEPIRLGIASLATLSPAAAAEMIEEGILEVPFDEELEPVLHRDLRLAARCAGDCPALVPAFARDLARRCLDILLSEHALTNAPLKEKLTEAMRGLWLHDAASHLFKTVLLKALKGKNQWTCRAAAETLSGAVGDPEVAKALLAELKGKDKLVQAAAASAITAVAGDPGIRTVLLRMLRSSSDGSFSAAVALSGIAAGSEVRPSLLDALQHKDSGVRYRSVVALSVIAAEPDVRAKLVAALRDEDMYVRRQVALALTGANEHAEVQEALVAALRNVREDNSVRLTATRALSGAVKDVSVRTVLLKALSDRDDVVRSGAAEALAGAVGEPEVRVALQSLLRERNTDTKYVAVLALGGAVEEHNIRGLLIEALKREERFVRLAAARALSGAVKDVSVRTVLLKALSDRDDVVRSGAAEALAGAVGEPEVLNALLARMKDDRARVRRAAASALAGATMGAEVRPTLLDMMDDEYAVVRSTAWTALDQSIART